MKKFFTPKVVLLIIVCIIVAAIIYFVVSVFVARDKDVFVAPDASTPASSGETPPSSPTTDTAPSSPAPDEPTPTTATDDDTVVTTPPTTPSDAYINITPPDCARECAPYKYDEKELTYCKNVCGLTDGAPTSDCDARSGLAKDYCLKDRAIAAKDAAVCEHIADGGIKKTCITRLQQEFIENM